MIKIDIYTIVKIGKGNNVGNESQPFDEISSSLVPHCEMCPLRSRFHNLLMLVVDPAGHLAPNHALLLDKVVVLRPDRVDVVSLACRVAVEFGHELGWA